MIKLTGPLKALWTAKEQAAELSRVAHREVRDSKWELGTLMDERTRPVDLSPKKAAERLAALEAEIQRVRDELAYSREYANQVDDLLAKAERALAAAMGSNRG